MLSAREVLAPLDDRSLHGVFCGYCKLGWGHCVVDSAELRDWACDRLDRNEASLEATLAAVSSAQLATLEREMKWLGR